MKKYDKGKLRYDLIPPCVLKDLATIMTYGAEKYGENNWKECTPEESCRYVAAMFRHFESWRSGEKKDPESGRSHLAHALTNITFLLFLEKQEQENK